MEGIDEPTKKELKDSMAFYKRLTIDERINLKGNYARAASDEYDGYDDSLFFPLASAEGIAYLWVAYVFYGEHKTLWSELLTEEALTYSA